MMKIRYALLLSVSCLGLGSLANAELSPDITPVGKNTFIFTQRGAPAGESPLLIVQGIEKALGLSHPSVNEQEFSCTSYTHLASQSKLLSATVIARRTSSDEAIHYNINGSPRGLLSARDDNSDDFLSTHLNPIPTKRLFQSLSLFNNLKSHCLARRNSPPDCFCLRSYQEREYRKQATAFLPLIGKDRMSRKISQYKELEAPRLLLTEQDAADLPLTASVCFITDAGHCRGDEYDYGGANTPDNSSGGTPGGGGSSGGDNGNTDEPEWELDNKERCNKEGYVTTKCNSVENPVNYCPYDNTYFEKCVCKPNLQTCTKPYYGVGESCGGKYASCKLDNPRACKEDGYTQTGNCNSVQNINRRCPYDANYFDKCVCRSDLYICSSPLQGVGTACGGKYANCKCPSSYKSCSCGKASGASSCTWGGTTKYSSCKSCNSSSSSSSSSSGNVHTHNYRCPSGYVFLRDSGQTEPTCPCGRYSASTKRTCTICGLTYPFTGNCYRCAC